MARVLTPRRAAVWFTRKNYPAHRALDPGGLPATFEEWRSGVGLDAATVRVVFDSDQFAAWCRAEGREFDDPARTAYAQVVAAATRSRGWWRRGGVKR